MDNIRIAIIDSGISPLSEVSNNIIDSYVLQWVNSKYQITKEPYEDYIGHGTAVANIIWRINKNIDIICFRICKEELNIDESGLLDVLNYIYEKVDVDIINISAGITYLYNYYSLKDICSKLYEKGTIIVSAFDNDGAISFPAALDCVVGIDIDKDSDDKKEIILVKNGIVNILVADRYYRTEWLHTKTIIRGTSFACAYICGMLSIQIENITKEKNIEILLENISTKEISLPKHQAALKPKFSIQKAIVFPINKESQALLRFKELLGFKIVGAFDERLSGKVGKTLFGETIKSYNDISWQDDFDTIILSYVSDLSALTKRNYVEEIISNAKLYGKNIYSFEQINAGNNHLFFPTLSTNNVPVRNNFKLHKTTIPVVGIFGTSSKQGKFTMQQKIINCLKTIGYNVGSILTEPSGYLFDADYIFHFGFRANFNLQPWECIAILNEMIWEIQLKNKDILITGCQSGSTHYNNSNINDFALYQHSFILGTLPDIYILCVNPHDDFDYINKTISFLNSIDSGKVKAIAVFPMKAIATLSGIGYKTEEINHDEFLNIKAGLECEFNLPVFSMNDDDINRLCALIIDEFSEE